MYVNTGLAKGKKLKYPKGRDIRPTTSKVKKSIFDTLGNIEGLKVLDLFCGSGSLGIEALSRGARFSVFVDNDRVVIKQLSENIENCGFKENSEIIFKSFSSALKSLIKQREKFDIIFIDPPYKFFKNTNVDEIIRETFPLLFDSGTIVLEHDLQNREISSELGAITKKYGGTLISYIRRKHDE